MGIVDNALIGASGQGGYFLTRSLRFRSSASAYLSRTPASAGNRQIFTFSGWVKRGALGARQGIIVCTDAPANNYFDIEFIAADQLDIQGSNGTWRLATSAVYRDPSAWYHIVLAVDTTQATASNRVKLYVNGSQVTAFSTASYPTLNSNCYFNLNAAHSIGSWQPASGLYFDGYMTEVNFIDGQALTPSSFGSTNTLTGVWQPARYTGTYGTNGYYLPFTDNSGATATTIGKDFSGNSNNWTPNNISVTAGVTYDSMTDVPTLTSATAANFAVMNPLMPSSALSWGNLRNTASAASATIQINSGKWYFESVATTSTVVDANNYYVGITGGNFLVYAINGNRWNGSAWVAFGASYATGDVIGIAFDATAGTATFYKNNVSQGTQTGTGGLTVYPYSNITSSNTNSIFDYNFGQRPFAYTPPTGFVALNTYNLPTSTIVKGNTVMDATIWTGDGASPRSITNSAGFKPDLVWAKNRSTSGYWNVLFDSVRGAGNQLSSNQTDAELASASNVAGKVSAFNSNGFSLEVGNTSIRSVNGSAETYVGWQWQAGQGTNTTNTNGTITSTVSVNASAGFSVVTYTGTGANATVGHGLGVAPSLIIGKSRSGTTGWLVYHQSIGNTNYLILNATDASAAATAAWNNTSPTSSVFTIGTASFVNTNGSTQVAYCWTPIAGYSAFGSYNGSGSADGPFIYTGFQPKFVLIKASSTTSQWVLWDAARNTYNVTNSILYPNLSAAEASFSIDILSNGFKFREAGGAGNDSGVTYIYAAFATSPFKNSLAR